MEEEGYQVNIAENGINALSIIETFLPDLIILDLMMPGMDGYEVTRRIRQNTALPFIPILLITGHDSPNVAHGLDLGANDFIRKPVTVDELLARVRSLLRMATMLRKTAVESTEASTAQSSLETPQQRIMKAQVSSEQASLHTQQFANDKLTDELVEQQKEILRSKVFYHVRLKGQGIASRLSNGRVEFRTNIFKTTLRGHALRIFSGLTDETTANHLVGTLFGSVELNALIEQSLEGGWGEKNVEPFGMNFRELSLHLNTFDQSYGGLTSVAKEELTWQLTQLLLNASTNNTTDNSSIKTFFRNVREQATAGLLEMSFNQTYLKQGIFDLGYTESTYEVEGEVNWLLRQQLTDLEYKTLQRFIKALTSFAMLLGGFGKSWQRADHRLFFPQYYSRGGRKALIGCHWEWVGQSLIKDVQVRQLGQVNLFIDKVRQSAQEWMQLQGFTPNPKHKASWYEAWHPDNVQVWGRLANDQEDSVAVAWFHLSELEPTFQTRNRRISIHRSSITGLTGQSNRVWHRMYPIVRLVKDPHNPDKPLPRKTENYLELVTFFPDSSLQESTEFLSLLRSEKSMTKLWPS